MRVATNYRAAKARGWFYEITGCWSANFDAVKNWWDLSTNCLGTAWLKSADFIVQEEILRTISRSNGRVAGDFVGETFSSFDNRDCRSTTKSGRVQGLGADADSPLKANSRVKQLWRSQWNWVGRMESLVDKLLGWSIRLLVAEGVPGDRCCENAKWFRSFRAVNCNAFWSSCVDEVLRVVWQLGGLYVDTANRSRGSRISCVKLLAGWRDWCIRLLEGISSDEQGSFPVK